MHDEEVSGFHNPVVHELSLAGWLVSKCLQHEAYWSSPQERGHILWCCGEVVASVGELVDRLCDQDEEMAEEVRRLAALLAHRGEQLEDAKE